MGWATDAIARLQAGETVTIRPRGHSMRGKVEDGEVVTVEPLRDRMIAPGDIVLCKVNGRRYLHLIKATRGAPFQIGNNRGGINGWVARSAIYGIATKVGG